VTEDDSVFIEYVVLEKQIVGGKEIEIPVYVDESVMASYVGAEVQHVRTQSSSNMKAMLIIKADRNVRFGTMQKIMDSLREFNLRTFQIVTEFESEEDA
jgi:biopolymer transport protein ExbD